VSHAWNVGLLVPETVEVGQQFDIAVRGLSLSAGATLRINDVDSGSSVRQLELFERDGEVRATAIVDQPGLYRVMLRYDGQGVTQLLMVTEATRQSG
jgi:hypothetical protein